MATAAPYLTVDAVSPAPLSVRRRRPSRTPPTTRRERPRPLPTAPLTRCPPTPRRRGAAGLAGCPRPLRLQDPPGVAECPPPPLLKGAPGVAGCWSPCRRHSAHCDPGRPNFRPLVHRLLQRQPAPAPLARRTDTPPRDTTTQARYRDGDSLLQLGLGARQEAENR